MNRQMTITQTLNCAYREREAREWQQRLNNRAAAAGGAEAAAGL